MKWLPVVQAYFYDVDELHIDSAPEPKATVTQDGDGTVSLRSLQVHPLLLKFRSNAQITLATFS